MTDVLDGGVSDSDVLDGRYVLGERIGAGGAASVHRAVDRRLGREVAVKVLDDLAASHADPAGRERFVREAQTAARLHHPHVVTVFDAGEADGRLYLVMQLVEGTTLAEVIAERAPLATEEAARLTIQILRALDAAHRHGIVHRDVKPANVVIDEQGDAHLTDFGIAWTLGEIEDHLTSAGKVVGTPSYLAPEQATGAELGAATDVYLAGLVLDEMLTGRRTNGDTPSAAIAAELAALAGAFEPRDVNPTADERLSEAVVRATDPDPSKRFATAVEMIEAIDGRAGAPVTEPTRTLAMTGAATSATEVMPMAVRPHDPTVAFPSTPAAAQPRPPAVGRRPVRRRWMLFAAAIVAVLGVASVAALTGDGADQPGPGSTVAPPSTTVAVTTSVPSTTAAPVVDSGGGGGGGGGNGNGRGNGGGNGNGNGRGNG